MGNVLAASSKPSSMKADFGMPDLDKPKTHTPLAPMEAVGDEKYGKRENPGTVEELHKKCKEIQAMPFEGARVMLNKCLSNHFQVSHTINLSNTQPSGYRFGATYVGNQQFGPTEVYPVLIADLDPTGNLNANILHQFSPRLRCKFVSQIQDSKLAGLQITADYRGSDYTASFTTGNPNIFTKSGVFIGHFLQSVTPKLALGAELAYQVGTNVPGGQVAVVSAVGRYTNGDSIWSGSLGLGGLNLCYYQKASDQLQIGVEWETNLRMQESVATLGYQIDLPKADLVFKGSLDTQWNVCGVLEKRLQPLPFTFAISGRINHTKNQFRLGCGLMIG